MLVLRAVIPFSVVFHEIPYRRSVTAFLAVALSLLFGGCESIRLHDEGRLKSAAETVALAAELSTGSGAVFDPMEENLATVQESQVKILDLSRTHEFDTFLTRFSGFSAGKVAQELIDGLSERKASIDTVKSSVSSAAEAVNTALDRQKLIAKANKEAVKAKGDLEEALKRVNKRLDWIEKTIEKIIQWQKKATESEAVSSAMPNLPNAADKDVKDIVKSAKDAITKVEKSAAVDAANKLLQQTIQKVGESEQTRIIEMKRHLGEIKRLRDSFRVRDQIAICTLFTKITANLYPALTGGGAGAAGSNFEKLVNGLSALTDDAGTKVRYKCIATMIKLRNWGITPPVALAVRTHWAKDTVADFVAADITASKADGKSPHFVAALGILLFHEREFFADVRWALAREHHRHSIRLSRINAQERADLIHQLIQGLQIYYQGGIKADQVTELLLMAGQVGALTLIGINQ